MNSYGGPGENGATAGGHRVIHTWMALVETMRVLAQTGHKRAEAEAGAAAGHRKERAVKAEGVGGHSHRATRP